jgi:hypothetical protein
MEGMLSHTGTIIVLGCVVGFGLSAVSLSIFILYRGKLYHRLSPEARPRRWVLISLLVLFAVFVIWFPVWMTWPHALISRFLALLFGITFFVFGVASRFTELVDGYIKRRGWPLR